jgi:hypothetical protein
LNCRVSDYLIDSNNFRNILSGCDRINRAIQMLPKCTPKLIFCWPSRQSSAGRWLVTRTPPTGEEAMAYGSLVALRSVPARPHLTSLAPPSDRSRPIARGYIRS